MCDIRCCPFAVPALRFAGVPALYIAIACVIMLGVGILTGVGKTRQKDPPA